MSYHYAVLRRRYNEDEQVDQYNIIATTESDDLENARKVAGNIQGQYEDIYYVCDIARVTEPNESCECLFVVNRKGSPVEVSIYQVSHSGAEITSLPAFWEFSNSKPSMMLAFAAECKSSKISSKVIGSIILACLRSAMLDNIPEEARSLYDLIQMFIVGKITKSRVLEVNKEFRHIINRVINILYETSNIVIDNYGSRGDKAFEILFEIRSINRDVYYEQAPHIIRQHIPLRRILSAIAL